MVARQQQRAQFDLPGRVSLLEVDADDFEKGINEMKAEMRTGFKEVNAKNTRIFWTVLTSAIGILATIVTLLVSVIVNA